MRIPISKQFQARFSFFSFRLTLSFLSGLIVLGLFTERSVWAAVNCADSTWSVGNEADLSAAIVCYNSKTSPGSYHITLTQDIDLTASTSLINNTTPNVELVLEGNGYTVDGQDISGVRPFDIAADTKVILQNITITRGNNSGQNGGGLRNAGILTVTDSIFSQNSASDGGGIHNTGSVTITTSNLISNSAGFYGGGLYNAGSLTVMDSTLNGNEGLESGGGIANLGGVMTVTSITVSNNEANVEGGGLYNASNLTVLNSTFSGNSTSNGGGLYNADNLTILNSTFSNNAASGDGGGLYNRGILLIQK